MANPYQANLPDFHQLDAIEDQFGAAFIRLYQRRPFEQISVSALCKEAGLARSTFYHHFSNTWELRDLLEDNFVAGILKATVDLSRADAKNPNYRRYLTRVTSFVKDNRRLFKAFLVDQPTASFLAKYRASIKYHYYETGCHDDLALEVVANYVITLFRYGLEHDIAIDVVITGKYDRLLKHMLDYL